MTVDAVVAAAAAETSARGYLYLGVAAAVWLAWYGFACTFWPFARCWWCKGTGRKYQNEKRKTWRPCRWCKGSGRRLRIVRWIFNYFRGKRKEANR